jgi:hypothetical protein
MDSLLAPKVEAAGTEDYELQSEMDIEVADELIDYQLGASKSFKDKMLKKKKG